MLIIDKTNWIEKYYQWIISHPERVNQKISKIYTRMYENTKKEQVINVKDTKHTYVFDVQKANRPIKFIEEMLKQSKGQWSGKPLKLELFQKAFIQALFK